MVFGFQAMIAHLPPPKTAMEAEAPQETKEAVAPLVPAAAEAAAEAEAPLETAHLPSARPESSM